MKTQSGGETVLGYTRLPYLQDKVHIITFGHYSPLQYPGTKTQYIGQQKVFPPLWPAFLEVTQPSS